MTSSSLSLMCLVIVNICIINASTVEPKCLCCPDWKHSQIFRNSFGKNYPWVNIYTCSPLTKSKNKHLKEREKKCILLSTTHRKTNYTSNIHIFFSYFLAPRVPGLVVKLLTIIDWKWSCSSKMMWGRVNFPSLSSTGWVSSFSNLKGYFYLHAYMYLPTLPHSKNVTPGQFLNWVFQVWIQSFLSPRLFAMPSLPNYLPKAGGIIILGETSF